MNRYLLDTHVILWWLSEPEKLSSEALAIITDGRNDISISAAAGWEMAIKKILRRLDYPDNLIEVLGQERVGILNIRLEHALAVASLPLLHQDPFDRIMITQARMEQLTLITRDEQVTQYDVPTIVG